MSLKNQSFKPSTLSVKISSEIKKGFKSSYLNHLHASLSEQSPAYIKEGSFVATITVSSAKEMTTRQIIAEENPVITPMDLMMNPTIQVGFNGGKPNNLLSNQHSSMKRKNQTILFNLPKNQSSQKPPIQN